MLSAQRAGEALRKRHAAILSLLFILLLALALLDLFLGSVHIAPKSILHALFGSEGDAYAKVIVRNFRLPKLLTAILAGSSLSVSGLLMQTTFRNPLAGPSVLGISAGASLGASISLLAFGGLSALAPLPLALSACLGAMVTLLIILFAAARLRSNTTILILGIMLSAAASAIVNILQYFSDERALKSFVIWSMGSLANVTSESLLILSLAVILGTLMSYLCTRPLNVLLLGEQSAQSLGLPISSVRTIIFTATALLAGTVTAFCGPIGFIGVAAPHIARALLKTARHGPLITGTLLIGANALLIADIISQLPRQTATLPINAVASLLGLPVVIWLLIKGKAQ